jgi:hypothetical protein
MTVSLSTSPQPAKGTQAFRLHFTIEFRIGFTEVTAGAIRALHCRDFAKIKAMFN